MSDRGTLSFIFTVFMFFERLVVSGVAGANEDENFFYLSTRIYSNKDVFLHVASPVPPSGCYSKLVYFTQNTQKTQKLFAKSNEYTEDACYACVASG